LRECPTPIDHACEELAALEATVLAEAAILNLELLRDEAGIESTSTGTLPDCTIAATFECRLS